MKNIKLSVEVGFLKDAILVDREGSDLKTLLNEVKAQLLESKKYKKIEWSEEKIKKSYETLLENNSSMFEIEVDNIAFFGTLTFE